MRSLFKCSLRALQSTSKRKVVQLFSATRSVKVGGPKLALSYRRNNALHLWSSNSIQKRFYSSTDDKETTDPQIKASISRGFEEIDRDPKAALKIFNELYETTGNDESVLYGRATALFNLDRYDEALKVLDILSASHPNSPISALKGKIHTQLGNSELAISNFLDAVERFPNDFGILGSLGEAYLMANKYVEAIQSFQKANEIQPNNLRTILLMSSAYRDLGPNYGREALNFAIQAVKLQSQIPEVWHNLAGSLKNVGDVEAALDCYAKMTELQPAITAMSFQEAILLMQMNKLDEAEKLLLKLLEIPNNDDLHQRTGIQLIIVYTALRRHQEAKEVATRLTKKFPFSSAVWFHLGRTCMISDNDEAIQYFEHALSLDTHDENVLNALASSHFIKGQHEQAVKYFQQVNNFSVNILGLNGMFNEGQAVIEFLHKKFPDKAKAIYQAQMEFAALKRDFAEEFQTYRKIVSISKRSIDHVDLLLLNNDFEGALQKVDEILASSEPENEKFNALIWKAITLIEYGRVKEAITFLKMKQPEGFNLNFYEILAIALSRDNDSLDEAENYCNDLPANYATQMALSEVHYKRGEYEEAMASWKRAQAVNNSSPDNPFPMRYLAMQQHAKILEAMGKVDEAIEGYTKVLAINPLDLISKERLTALQAKMKKLT